MKVNFIMKTHNTTVNYMSISSQEIRGLLITGLMMCEEKRLFYNSI